jgi:uncharacterized protein (DUF1778 family)
LSERLLGYLKSPECSIISSTQGKRMTTTSRTAWLALPLPSESKQAIEDAAALAGQTVSEFAISALTQRVRSLIQDQSNTVLSKRDRDVFMKLLDRTDAKPNKALVAAARRYTSLTRKRRTA